jgi:hypothetical protein
MRGGAVIAYFVHDRENNSDMIVLPEMNCSVPVNAERMQAFISVQPVFAEWSGDACRDASPEDFGTVIATREEGGDVCVLKADIWRERMEFHLGHPQRWP